MTITHASVSGPLIEPADYQAAHVVAAGTITEAMQVLADNATNDVSTSKHGYAPKAPNDATKFLDGTGAYSVPASSGGLTASYLGHNAVGGSTVAFAGINIWYVKKVTPASDFYLMSVQAHVAMTSLGGTSPNVALWTDSSGPHHLLTTSPSNGGQNALGIVGHAPTNPDWFGLPLAWKLDSGSSFWVGIAMQYQVADWQIYYDTSGSDGSITMTDTGYVEDGDYRGSFASGTKNFSIRLLGLS